MVGLIPNYRVTSRQVGLSRRLVTLSCHVGSSRSVMSNKQTRGGANIKLVPLDSSMHGPYITINLDTLTPPPRFFATRRVKSACHVCSSRWRRDAIVRYKPMVVPDSVFNKIISAYSWFGKWNIALIQYIMAFLFYSVFDSINYSLIVKK